jgi:hypothetical protein
MTPEEVESLFHRLPPVRPSPDLRERLLREARKEAALSPLRPPEAQSKPSVHFLKRFWGSVPLAASLIAILAIVVTIIIGIPHSRPNPLTPGAPPSGQETPVEKLIEELGAEDPQVRARAFRNLLDKGESIRPALEKALSHSDAEVRGRARELLVHLDRDPKQKKILEHSGRLGDGSSFWIASDVFDLVSNPKYLPEWMKPTLVDSVDFVVAFVDFEGTNVTRSQIVHVNCKTVVAASGLVFPPHLHMVELLGSKNGVSMWVEPDQNALIAQFTAMAEPRGPGLFQLWSRGRTQLAIVAKRTEANNLISAITNLLSVLSKTASSEEKLTLRAAALHALRHFFHPTSVETAIKALEDPRKDIRDIAQNTLRWIVRVPEKDSDAPVRKWKSLKEEERESHLLNWHEFRGKTPVPPPEKERGR